MTRLIHPITLSVILVGVGGFLLGLIVAVERQDTVVDTPVAVPSVDVEAVNRLRRSEAELASRETQLADAQAELVKLRAEAPTAAAIADAESRIVSLEAALANSSGELTTLQGEITELAGQLAAAIQSRDEMSAQIERTQAASEKERASFEQTVTGLRRQLVSSENERNGVEQANTDLRRRLADGEAERSNLEQTNTDLRRLLVSSENERNGVEQANTDLRRRLADGEAERSNLEQTNTDLRQQVVSSESERTSLEQTIADLRLQLEVAEVRPSAPAAAAPENVAPDEAPAGTSQSAAAENANPEPTVAAAPASVEPPVQPAEVAAPPTTPAEPNPSDQQIAAVARPLGPISQGIAAYRAAAYRKAYELWLPRALQGSSRAQFFVGALYFEGRGVPADRVLAYMWLRAATKKDDPGAIKLLDRVREGMTGPELAEAESRIASGETIPAQ